jgi:hypothetical protein
MQLDAVKLVLLGVLFWESDVWLVLRVYIVVDVTKRTSVLFVTVDLIFPQQGHQDAVLRDIHIVKLLGLDV